MSAVCLATTTAKLTRPADYSPRSVLLPQLQQPTCCQRDDDFLSKLFQLLAMHKRALDIKLIMANREKPFTDHPSLSLSLSCLALSLSISSLSVIYAPNWKTNHPPAAAQAEN